MSENKKIIITRFHALWCGHCKVFAKEWEKIEERVREKKYPMSDSVEIKLQSLEESEDPVAKGIDNKINGEEVQGFPTIKIEIGDKQYEFGKDGPKFSRDADGIFAYIESLLNSGQTGGSRTDYRGKYKKYKTKYASLLKKYNALKKQ